MHTDLRRADRLCCIVDRVVEEQRVAGLDNLAGEPFARRERFQGVLLIITVTTNGKWRLSFEEAAPHQMQKKTSWAAITMLVSGKRKTIASVP